MGFQLGAGRSRERAAYSAGLGHPSRGTHELHAPSIRTIPINSDRPSSPFLHQCIGQYHRCADEEISLSLDWPLITMSFSRHLSHDHRVQQRERFSQSLLRAQKTTVVGSLPRDSVLATDRVPPAHIVEFGRDHGCIWLSRCLTRSSLSLVNTFPSHVLNGTDEPLDVPDSLSAKRGQAIELVAEV
jgi:hypothetical protein